jgi:citrate lyase subunit beta/citryl-CoA lyase
VDLAAGLAAARSFLIFPGNDERKLARALASGADAVVLDLEDGVAEGAKEEARAMVASFVEGPWPGVRLVRVNDPAGEHGVRDLEAVARVGTPVGVVVPKASPAAIERAASLGVPLVALVEDAAAVRDVDALAEQPAVAALALGRADLEAALGLVPDGSGNELLYVRSRLVVASSAAGIRPPIDGPCLELGDHGALERETLGARALGVRGKLCIHPGQVPVVHRALAPSPAEVGRAREIVAAWEGIVARGEAVGVVDGALVDLPVAEQALGVIRASEGSGAP